MMIAIIANQTQADPSACSEIQMNIHFEEIKHNRRKTQICEQSKKYCEVFSDCDNQEDNIQ